MVFWRDYNWGVWICVCSWCLSPGPVYTRVYNVLAWHVTGTIFLKSDAILSIPVMQIVLVYIPLLYYLNCALSRNSKTCYRWLCSCIMIVCVLVQILWGLTAYPYGYMALILSPGGTWPLMLTLWLLFKTSSFKNPIASYNYYF